MKKIVAIIPARGGSKGIPKKNIKNICGKPLIVWSILQAKQVEEIDSVWVTSDSDEILEVCSKAGAEVIKRPDEISGDTATSESAWLHALNMIESQNISVEAIVAMQATSPIRHPSDLKHAIQQFRQNNDDSLFSSNEIEDFFFWRLGSDGFESVNYDYKNRKRRQNIEKRYLENGSFYIMKPEIIKNYNNRLGGKIDTYLMERYKMFQIDDVGDIELCEKIMMAYDLDKIS